MLPNRTGRDKRARQPASSNLYAALFACAALQVFDGCAEAVAAEPALLTERAAIGFALERPAYRATEESRVGVAESHVIEAGLLPNPHAEFSREQLNGAAGRSVESSLRLSQAFDVSGRRALRREAAEQRLEAARWEGRDLRLRTVAELRRVFADALHRQSLVAAQSDWLQRLESAYRIVERLTQAGESAGYDRRRLDRERQTARAHLARTRASLARARETLAGWIGRSAQNIAGLAGPVMPDPAPSLDAATADLRRRPDVQVLLAQAEAFERERRSAERAWIPDVTVGAGPKRVEEPGRNDSGFIVSLAVPLPLFDRGQGAERRARAQADLSRAEHALRLQQTEAEIRGVWRQAVDLRQTAEVYRADLNVTLRELTRIAEEAYRGGEGNLLQLLDAYRSELDAESTLLDLELAARLARIELDTLSGARVHE